MKKALKKLWDKVMKSNTLPIVFGLLTILAILTWLVAAIVFGVTSILDFLGVM